MKFNVILWNIDYEEWKIIPLWDRIRIKFAQLIFSKTFFELHIEKNGK